MNNNIVSKPKRVVNLIIDTVFCYFTTVFILAFIYFDFYNDVMTISTNLIRVYILIALFFYYLLCEYFYGKTLGKFITKTKVISFKNDKPTFLAILIRTICRFIPFYFLSFLGTSNLGLHDLISKTKVITEK